MRDGGGVLGTVQDLQHSKVDADGTDVAGFQNDPRPVIDPHPPVADPPGAVHLHMRMDAGGTDPDGPMLAATEDVVDHLPGEVDGGEPRYPDIAAGQRPSGQLLSQRVRGVPD